MTQYLKPIRGKTPGIDEEALQAAEINPLDFAVPASLAAGPERLAKLMGLAGAGGMGVINAAPFVQALQQLLQGKNPSEAKANEIRRDQAVPVTPAPSTSPAALETVIVRDPWRRVR